MSISTISAILAYFITALTPYAQSNAYVAFLVAIFTLIVSHINPSPSPSGTISSQPTSQSSTVQSNSSLPVPPPIPSNYGNATGGLVTVTSENVGHDLYGDQLIIAEDLPAVVQATDKGWYQVTIQNNNAVYTKTQPYV